MTSTGVARVTDARGQTKILRPPPKKKFLKNDNNMSSIQLIMCIIISAYPTCIFYDF